MTLTAKIFELSNDRLEFERDVLILISSLSDLEEATCFNDILEELQDVINSDCIMYSSCAMDFLKEHDVSLKESLEEAHNLGYDIKDINSEFLATILHQRYLYAAMYELETEIDELIRKNYEEKHYE